MVERSGRQEIFVLEDIPPDYVVETAEHVVTREAISAFATEYDPQPMHLDDDAGRGSTFGGVIGSGWQTLAVTMRLLVDAGLLAPTPIIGAEFERMRFYRPLWPGDRLRVTARLLGTRKSTSRPERGFADFQVTTVNQDNASLVDQTWTLLVPARPA